MAAAGETATLQTLEAAIDRAAAALWGLSPADLRAIQVDLLALTGPVPESEPAEESA